MMNTEIIIHSHDAEFANRLAKMLQQAGYVTTENSITNYLHELISQMNAGLLIIDNYLASDDFMLWLAHFRDSRQVKTLPILVLSSPDQIAQAKSFIDDDHVDFLSKPILYSNLISKVSARLRQRG